MTPKNLKTTDYTKSLKILLLQLHSDVVKLFACFLGFWVLGDSDYVSEPASPFIWHHNSRFVCRLWRGNWYEQDGLHLLNGVQRAVEDSGTQPAVTMGPAHLQTHLVSLWEAAAHPSYP